MSASKTWLRRFATGASLMFVSFAMLGLSGVPSSSQEDQVTIALVVEPENLDPCDAPSDRVGKVLLGNIVERLLDRDLSTGQLKPELATSWEQVDDRTWRFHLREGVQFHDGSPFNAEAAKYSIDRSMNENIACQIREKFFSDRSLEVTVVDDMTIDIATDIDDPILPLLLSAHVMHPLSVPLDENVRVGGGTGPYRFVDWQAGRQIVLERNPDYWGDAPDAARVVFVWRSESTVRTAMVVNGEADLATDISFQDAQSHQDISASFPNAETTRIVYYARPPMTDPRVRAAINYAIDREGLRGTILAPGVEFAKALVRPSVNGHNPDLAIWPYKPDVARALIADAAADGVPVDREIEFIGRQGHFPNVGEFMEAVTAMLHDAGLNVRLRMVEGPQRSEMMRPPYPDEPRLFVDQHDNTLGDAVATLFHKGHSEGRSSLGTDDPYLDFLIDYATQQTGVERTWAWQRAFERLNLALVREALLYHMVGFVAIGPRIDFAPTERTRSEIRLADIKLK